MKRSKAEIEIVADRIPGYELLIVATHYRGHANGAMLLSRETGADSWDAEDRLLLNAVAGQLGIALQQISDQRELERLSRTDSLTGLLNRRAFMDELAWAMERTQRSGVTSAVLYMDLNNFKAVNDLHGHAEGDNVLKKLSWILRDATRRYDFVARLGGDEFAIWVENIEQKTLRRRTRELMQKSQELFSASASTDKPLGLSIGAVLRHPKSLETPEQILKRADAAMYRVKHGKKRNTTATRSRRRGERRD